MWNDQREKMLLSQTQAQQVAGMAKGETRTERYERERNYLNERLALLDEAIAALKSNPETERIINLLDAL